MGVLDSFSLAGRVALVTGGSRGLGFAIARALGEAGAAVGLVARDGAAVASAAESLAALGIRTFATSADVRSASSVDAAVSAVSDALGAPVSVLVNNAGISIPGRALEVEPSDWSDVLSTNLDGVFHCSRAVCSRLVAAGMPGTIVNVGSMSAFIVNQPRWQPAYLASKAAVHQLTRALAAEWAPHGVRVNAIAPGYFLTEQSPVDQPEFRATCVEPAALKRWGEPHELGPAVTFLASEASSFMTGSIVVIDGGFTLF
ncbi:SDR family NAD(P)-dependent oxidoreductase [Tenggerimyces flavus]|uniref:SDR family NAD(P)-dependent oxidoreductase n=1 Tax=Tenggerimyces flavus TaxID=1708749 RepID=A0ABV7YBX8_9ACTN|nr:SDR family oxidoreductase [Tenggerimyces flavus]MBM7788965.1 NAD(P)-dependent dehydrogenase (short-subunit alcohol dehydrogenase family) [Tenggerimyces flavus]